MTEDDPHSNSYSFNSPISAPALYAVVLLGIGVAAWVLPAVGVVYAVSLVLFCAAIAGIGLIWGRRFISTVSYEKDAVIAVLFNGRHLRITRAQVAAVELHDTMRGAFRVDVRFRSGPVLHALSNTSEPLTSINTVLTGEALTPDG
jgi:hypothetical protein